MEKILVPFDGSDNSLRAVQHAAKIAKLASPPSHIELLFVEDPVPLRLHASLSAQEIQRIETAEADRILQPARAVLDSAGVSYEARWRAGSPGNEIARQVREAGCTAVIMGTRGLGPVASVMVGSVATKVLHLIDVPITLVK